MQSFFSSLESLRSTVLDAFIICLGRYVSLNFAEFIEFKIIIKLLTFKFLSVIMLVSQSVDNDDLVSSEINGDVCFSCKKPIKERHLLKVRGFHRPWHVRCLRCSVCQVPLDREASCFYRGHNIYCRTDYIGYRYAHFRNYWKALPAVD